MPKIKTHKASVKRFKRTKKGKFLQTKGGQDHFNARESSKKTMNKRKKESVSKNNIKALKKLIPYHKAKKYAR